MCAPVERQRLKIYILHPARRAAVADGGIQPLQARFFIARKDYLTMISLSFALVMAVYSQRAASSLNA